MELVEQRWSTLRLRMVHRGEPSETRTFVDEFQAPVVATLGRAFPRQRALIEDLTQETFMRALGAIRRFDPAGPGTLRRWITTIATRVAIDEARRQGRHLLVEPPDEFADQTPRTPELAAELQRALARLDGPAQLIVALRLIEGMTAEEAASALGIETGTVKSRLSRARAKLRGFLGATA